MFNRKRKQPEMIVVQTMLVGRTRPAVARFFEIVDGLLEMFRMAGCPFDQEPFMCGHVVNGPMMPGSARCIGVVAEKHETAGLRWRICPSERRGNIFAVAGVLGRHWRAIGKGS